MLPDGDLTYGHSLPTGPPPGGTLIVGLGLALALRLPPPLTGSLCPATNPHSATTCMALKSGFVGLPNVGKVCAQFPLPSSVCTMRVLWSRDGAGMLQTKAAQRGLRATSLLCHLPRSQPPSSPLSRRNWGTQCSRRCSMRWWRAARPRRPTFPSAPSSLTYAPFAVWPPNNISGSAAAPTCPMGHAVPMRPLYARNSAARHSPLNAVLLAPNAVGFGVGAGRALGHAV